ncbi:MAG: hypothetical protein WD468_07390 [Pirellulales bacterium]
MNDALQKLLALIKVNDGINDKARLARIVFDAFGLTKDRSVYYGADFAIRFSSSASRNFGNTVFSLSNLRKYDDRPFIVCLVTPTENHCLLGNTTLLKKISHSSQQLRENNIRGSFNGSDIAREFEGIANSPENIGRLFDIHAGIGFEGNLARLVEATNNISPTGIKFAVSEPATAAILAAPQRAARFVESEDYTVLKAELNAKVSEFRSEILLAALIENVNVRGRVIEYLIAGEDEALRQKLIAALKAGDKGIPKFKTDNTLGDYTRIFPAYHTETDVKTKIMILSSNPKAYNLDKMLEFLANSRSVFMFYFVGVDPGKIVNTVLVSMFQEKLLRATIMLKHWAGRNSRGVTQFEGRTINDLIAKPEFAINTDAARQFLERVIAL